MSAPSTESAAIRRLIRVSLTDGWKPLHVIYTDNEEVPVTNESEALEAILAVDEAYLRFTRGEGDEQEWGWIRFVMGNDPDEVACDYTVNLTAVDRETSSWWSR